MSGATQTQNSILRISDEKTLQLIELYEKEECLWNTLSDEYKCREKRQKAAERIARKLNIKYFESRHVVIKFKNLRNSYCQELKKIAASLSMGLSEEELYRPKVFWFSKMDSFLRPHLQPARCSFPTMPVPEFEIDVDVDRIKPGVFEDRVKLEPPEPQYIGSESNEQSEDSLPDMSYPTIEHSESLTSEDFSRLERKGKKRSRDYSIASSSKRPREDNIAQMMREILNKIEAMADAKKEDYYDNFGKYIASLLRSMSKERAMLLQPQVISLIVSGSGIGEGSVSQSDV